MGELVRAPELYTEFGDRRGMSQAIGNMGIVHCNQGRYAEAMECFGRQLAISEELGDRSGMSTAIGNMGIVHWYLQERYAEAMECFGRQLAISEELGDRDGMSAAIGNMGNVRRQSGAVCGGDGVLWPPARNQRGVWRPQRDVNCHRQHGSCSRGSGAVLRRRWSAMAASSRSARS